MHKSLILFKKPELKTCIRLKTFSEVTLLLGMTIFCVLLGTSSEMTFLLGITVFLVRITCSAKNTYVKDAGTEGACIAINCARNVCAIKRSEIYLKFFWILEIGGAR